MDTRILSDNELIYNISNKHLESIEQTFEEFIESLTPAKKMFATSIIELYKRYQSKKQNLKTIRCSDDIYNYMKSLLIDLSTEECWVLLLNQSARVISKEKISSGGLTATVVDVRCVLRAALMKRATSIILVHNHPSGNTRPSMDDDSITNKIKEAASLVNIRMLDHIIISSTGGFYSYSDECRL